MATTTLSAAVGAALVKKVVDDIYDGFKKSGINMLGKARSDVKESAIARALNSTTKVKTLWNIEKEVSLYDFYYPSTIEFSKDTKKKISAIKDFGHSGHFVIQGTAGQGKSIFLRYLCGQELNPTHTSGRVPIFIELRRITKEQDLKSLIQSSLEKYKLPHTPEAWKALAESGKFILLLDAFDEIDPLLVTKTIGDLEALVELHHESLQIIITSRPDSDIQKSNFFRVFRLSQLSATDHAPFLKKICSDKEQAESLLKVLKDSTSDVSSLLTTPLMMTLLVILYKSLQTIPDTVPKFYEELFDVLFYRHDHSKPGFRRKRYTQLDDGIVKRLFSAFCFYSRLKGYGVLTNQQLHECCAQAAVACNQAFDAEKFKSELVKTICLMQEEGFEVSFIHRSVAQYYAASFVRNSGEEFAQRFYNLAKENRGWELEIKFLSQIDTYRFAKYFEMPQLLGFANAAGISVECEAADDAKKIHEYLSSVVSVVSSVNIDKKKGGNSVTFLGWSSSVDILGVERQTVWGEFIFAWIRPLIDHLSTLRAPQLHDPDAGVRPEQHAFTKVATYESYLVDASKEAQSKVLEKFKSRFSSCKAIIDTEENKARMLESFLSS